MFEHMNHCIISNDQLQKAQSIPLRGHETLKHIFADLNRLQIGEYLCMSLERELVSLHFNCPRIWLVVLLML